MGWALGILERSAQPYRPPLSCPGGPAGEMGGACVASWDSRHLAGASA